MPYVIDTRSGQQIVVPDEALNEQLSIKLVGRNYANYGEPIAENFVDLVTNFAFTSAPARAIEGQVWYDTGTQQLRVYDENAQWRSASTIRVLSGGPPTGNTTAPNNTGSMYFAEDLGKLFVRDSSAFVPASIPGEIIDPSNYLSNSLSTVPAGVSNQYGTRLRNVFLSDDTDTYRAVLALDYQSNTQNAIAVFNGSDDFVVNTSATHYSDGASTSSAYINQLTDSDNLGTTIYSGLNVHDAAIADLRLSNGLLALSNSVVIGSASEPFDQAYFGTVTANTVIADVTGNVTGTVSDISNHSTSDLSEGTNLYFTVERVRGNISGSGNIIFDANTGVISESLTTTDVDEGDNLYWTTARGNAMVADYDGDIDTSGNITAVEFQGDLVGNVTGQVSDISNHDTGDLAEGVNLYFTTARVRGNVSATNTGTGFGDLSYDSGNGVFTFDRVTAAEIRSQLSQGTGISYSSATGEISVDQANVNHDSLAGFVSNEHIDHSAVSIVAGAGLTGGGNITATRSIDIGQGYGISVGADSISVSNTQVRGLVSVEAGSQSVLTYNSTTGVITFLGDSDVVNSSLGTWIRTANVAQDVFGVKSWKNEVRFENGGVSNNIVINNDPTIAYSDPGLSFNGTSGNVFFGSTGSITASNDITAFSDRKLKDNLAQIEGALDKVCALTGYIYDRIDQPGVKQTGLIAQDVQQVLPEAVSEHNDTLTVAYGNMMGLIVEAIKELKQEVQELKKQREG